MNEQKSCQGCYQKHDCQRLYEQIGNARGPSIVKKVIAAFLLPLSVFITSLAIFESMFAGITKAEQIRTAISFLLATLTTFVCILIIKAINRQFSQS